jgi:hypothetical protein
MAKAMPATSRALREGRQAARNASPRRGGRGDGSVSGEGADIGASGSGEPAFWHGAGARLRQAVA